MKVVYFYVDHRTKKEKVKQYSLVTFKIALMLVLLALDTSTATTAFKLGNIVEVLR